MVDEEEGISRLVCVCCGVVKPMFVDCFFPSLWYS